METSQRPGCLLFAIPRVMLGRSAPAALPDGLTLPTLDTASIDPIDLPRVIRVRNAARSCHQHIRKAKLAESATLDAGRELVGWIASLYSVGARLREGRAFVLEHGPDKVARLKAEVELELLEASFDQIPQMKRQLKALDEHAGHTASVRDEVAQLQRRLETAAVELEALSARLGTEIGTLEFVHELRAWHSSTDLALEAFSDTVGEL